MATILDLTKSLELNLTKSGFFDVPKMQVKLAIDKSGSMRDEFECDWVQSTIDLFLAAAIKFDDNGKLELGFFNHHFYKEKDATVEDIGTYIKKYGIYAEGGTNFSGAIEEMKYKTSGKAGFFSFARKQPKKDSVYLALITDGENGDKRNFEDQLDSIENTFVQIIGIGNQVNISYLDAVANRFKNVSVVYLPDPAKVTPDSFYELLLNKSLKSFVENKE